MTEKDCNKSKFLIKFRACLSRSDQSFRLRVPLFKRANIKRETVTGSRDSVEYIVTRLRDRRPGLESQQGKKRFFDFPKCPDRLWDPSSLLLKVCWGSVPGVKRPAREVDYSHL
jgi:hypothetical protein